MPKNLLNKIRTFATHFGKCKFGSILINTKLGLGSKVHRHVKCVSVELGNYSYIGDHSKIANCKIGRYTSIGQNVRIGYPSHPTNKFSTSPYFYAKSRHQLSTFKQPRYNYDDHVRFTLIGNDVWIGNDVKIVGNVEIGTGAVLAMGAVITKSVPAYTIVGGNPARFIKYRFNQDLVNLLLNSEWWDKSEYEIMTIMDEFEKIRGNKIVK